LPACRTAERTGKHTSVCDGAGDRMLLAVCRMQEALQRLCWRLACLQDSRENRQTNQCL
jgi:hypothetical protein